MKKLFLLLFLGYTGSWTYAQIAPDNRKIQVAILFDASNSMDGLLNQAKSRIWNIVNELSTYRYDGNQPTIEFAIYQYGKDDLLQSQNYVEQIQNFTTDLDLISSKLFGIRTNGGSEFCGGVIQQAHKNLNWSRNSNDLKMVYIAGNEPFNQGPVNYKAVIPLCLEDEIFINTIYCGAKEVGIKEFWKDGSILGGGSYFNIDSDQKIKYIDTPYDTKIALYNDSLNSTYLGYGRLGASRKDMQLSEDEKASGIAKANVVERSVAKSKSVYSNAQWDIVDGLKNETIVLDSLKEEELPKELQNLSIEEKEAKIEELKENRERYQKTIQELGIERQKYIDSEAAKNTENKGDLDFGKSVNISIAEKANKIGFHKESD